MKKYLNQIENDITKYNDINIIYEKLKLNKNYLKLENNLKNILITENDYVYSKIIKLNKNNINLNEDLKLNSKIFKSNLKIIINCLSNINS